MSGCCGRGDMMCDEPGCTGVHSHGQPYATWCPRTRRRARHVADQWDLDHVMRTYFRKRNWANGNVVGSTGLTLDDAASMSMADLVNAMLGGSA